MQAIAYPSAGLAAMITRAASKQTYTTIRALVPPEHRGDAFRAYGYFRWVDDLLDGDVLNSQEQLAFLASQKQLLAQCLQGQPPRDLTAEEWLLVDLTQGSLAGDPGLRIYLQDMMAVMDFDVQRRGKRISQLQLDGYSRLLATAVTEAVYTFIGEECGAPQTTDRYLAADAAHIVHMLRDLHEDLEIGYINIPYEVLEGERIDPTVLKDAKVRAWVQGRVETAREYFTRGDAYLDMIDNPRCRLAGAWYAARFEGVLAAIEREDYYLRRDYSDCKGGRMMLQMAWQGLQAILVTPNPHKTTSLQAEPIRATAWEQLQMTPLPCEESLQK